MSMTGKPIRSGRALAVGAAAVMLAAVFASSAAAATMTVRRYAVILGSNDGGKSRVRLRYAGSDAKAFAKVLTSLGGLSSADTFLLADADVTQIRSAFIALAAKIRTAPHKAGRTEVVIYYSGHSDETGLLPGGQLLKYRELRKMVKELPADVRIVVLDSCASGALIRTKGGKRRPGFMVDASSKVKGSAIITSSSAHEQAQESDRIGASFFTHHLVSGLRGVADVNSDGKVTLSEAYQHAFHETLRRTQGTASGPQHPNYDINLAGTGDVVITSLTSHRSKVVLSRGLRGRLFIRNADKRLVVELDKAAGRKVELGLAPGKYKLTLRRKKGVQSASIVLPQGGKKVVSSQDFADMIAAVHRTRGGQAHPGHGDPDGVAMRPIVPVVVLVDDDSHPNTPEVAASVQFVPGLGTSGFATNRRVRHFSWNILAGRNASVRGVELGMVNLVSYDSRAGQFGLWNHVDRHVDGAQFSGIGSFAGGDVSGGQFSGLLNIGLGELEGVQFAGLGNIVGDSAAGLQMSGLFNHAGAAFEGVQLSGLWNSARAMSGLQMSAGVNVATKLKGVQIGLVNIGKNVDGFMLGLVNVATRLDGGEAIGLISVVDDGYRHFEAWASDTAALSLGYKLGGRAFYTVFMLGADPYHDEEVRLRLGVGLGGHVGLGGRLGLDIDLTGSVSFDADAVDIEGLEPVALMKLRLALGYMFTRHFGIFAGITLNTAITFDWGEYKMSLFEDLGTAGDIQPVGATGGHGGTITVWPGFIVGLRI